MTRRARPPARPRRLRVVTAAAASAVVTASVLAGCDSSSVDDAAPATVTAPTGPTVAGAGDGAGASAAPSGADPAAGSEILAAYGELGPRAPVPPNAGGGTAGSGCRPGSSATLPDGVWMVRMVRVGGDGAGVAGLDLVCFSTAESLAAAGVDGAADSVANDSPRLRDVPFAGDASHYLQLPGPPTTAGETSRRVAFSAEQRGELRLWLERNGPVLVWALVRDGAVAETYAPPLAGS
ncbi:MAG: hypothetical protein ACFCVG_02140 [Kineosporiaceae bacterium]